MTSYTRSLITPHHETRMSDIPQLMTPKEMNEDGQILQDISGNLPETTFSNFIQDTPGFESPSAMLSNCEIKDKKAMEDSSTDGLEERINYIKQVRVKNLKIVYRE